MRKHNQDGIHVRCVMCSAKKKISLEEAAKGQPFCDKCFSPMVAEKVEVSS